MPGPQRQTAERPGRELCKIGEHAPVEMHVAYLVEARKTRRPPAQTVVPSIGARREMTAQTKIWTTQANRFTLR